MQRRFALDRRCVVCANCAVTVLGAGFESVPLNLLCHVQNLLDREFLKLSVLTRLEGSEGENEMIRFIAIAAFALAIATSAQAITLAPLHQSDNMITQVREACGAGRVRINGICVARTTKRQVRRCAVWGAGHVCRKWH
jgi:hypothetical protein